jgi:RNA polymerase sigma-70 factor (ECF subfamily)
MEQRSDFELVQEVRKGNRQAFTELMRRYQKRVYWTARRIVGSHEDADDVVQETFVKAYLGLGDFRGDSSFFTWLYRIAVNLSLNATRKRQLINYLPGTGASGNGVAAPESHRGSAGEATGSVCHAIL